MTLAVPARTTAGASRDPHLALAFAAVVVVVLEWGRGTSTIIFSPAWPALQAVISGIALVLAWRAKAILRFPRVLGIALVFQLSWLAVHIVRGVEPEYDPVYVYPVLGEALLSGDYPRAEYPPGAVLIFAFESLLSEGDTRVANAITMFALQLAIVACIWFLRTPWSPWLATVVAVWPANAFFLETKFDAAPTALLALGLLLAAKGKVGSAGVALGLGAAVKWTPALAALGLAVWLVARGRYRLLARHTLGFAAGFVALNLPFLLWQPGNVVAAYTTQGARGITGESLPYLPLRALGLASSAGGERLSGAADVPQWANVAAVAVQLAALLFILVVLTRVQTLASAVALAALVPVVFLLFNRVFSPQFVVLILPCWAIAIAAFAPSARHQLTLALLGAAAALANTLVYPTIPGWWELASAAFFTLALVTTASIVALSLADRSNGVASAPSRKSPVDASHVDP